MASMLIVYSKELSWLIIGSPEGSNEAVLDDLDIFVTKVHV
jgi:hypothetical protein